MPRFPNAASTLMIRTRRPRWTLVERALRNLIRRLGLRTPAVKTDAGFLYLVETQLDPNIGCHRNLAVADISVPITMRYVPSVPYSPTLADTFSRRADNHG